MDHSTHDHHAHMMHASANHDMHASPEAHRCQMSMLFTWSTKDLCLVFRSWHVHNTTTLILSLFAVIALSAGYEFVRDLARRYEARVDGSLSISEETSSLLPGRAGIAAGTDEVERRRRSGRFGKAVFYGVQVFYSFFIMLLFMTYNGWVMISVAIGSAIGYTLWGSGAAKSVACH
ncbi:unnamed protein product [Tuber melanosporum]|uniref:Copper transport protein n=1 Tax=Tuber melanosporum (strain Mel28) TaxID=656061 RepID=D5GIV6_TUBMM|nr:uncharacterized protein GSTUM_00008704001 [Tuber melanosporum]CAZ84449.1 unnamed protein product [Tuber melanosporum]